jgi:hypothetical protein
VPETRPVGRKVSNWQRGQDDNTTVPLARKGDSGVKIKVERSGGGREKERYYTVISAMCLLQGRQHPNYAYSINVDITERSCRSRLPHCQPLAR